MGPTSDLDPGERLVGIEGIPGQVRSMLTLRLFHGRTTSRELLPNWGRDGPTLGPLRGVGMTYGHLSLETAVGAIVELESVDTLWFYGGVLYADIDVSDEPPTEQASRRRARVTKRALRQALTVLMKLRRVEVSSRYASLEAVFLDSVAEQEGEVAATAARAALTDAIRNRQ